MTVALAPLSRENISNAADPISFDLGVGKWALGFALSYIGHAVVFWGSFWLRKLNHRLERDAFALRGICSAVGEVKPWVFVDPEHEVGSALQELEEKVLALHAKATEGCSDRHLKALYADISKTRDLALEMHEVILLLEQALAEHDRNAARYGKPSEDLQRFNAELRRQDDAPADHYDALAQSLRDVPESEVRTRH